MPLVLRTYPSRGQVQIRLDGREAAFVGVVRYGDSCDHSNGVEHVAK